MTKTCNVCHTVKPVECFYKMTRSPDGHGYTCRSCAAEYGRKYKQAHRKGRYVREYDADGQVCRVCGIKKPREEFAVDRKSPSGYGFRCKVCVRVKAREWRSLHPEHRGRQLARYYENREAKLAYSNAYAKRNRAEVSRKAAERYRTDPKTNIRTRLMSRLAQTITEAKPQNHRWHELLGYNTDQLMAHLVRSFLPGMTRENYGEWHIDHVVPVSAFNFSSVDDLDFKRCWALENLRPLWAVDNMRKHASIERPFQPSLALAL